MSFLFFRIYEHFQNRSMRLGFLCAFVVTFIGLPAFGQYMGTNVFASFDLIEYLGTRIDDAAVAVEDARYQAYLAQTNQLYLSGEEDQLIMLAEEVETEDGKLWSVEQMFKNVFAPTH
jgi:hypothetical protein